MPLNLPKGKYKKGVRIIHVVGKVQSANFKVQKLHFKMGVLKNIVQFESKLFSAL